MAFATKNWSDSKLSKGAKVWTAEESWDVSGATSKSEAIDTAVGDGSSHEDSSLLLVQNRDAESIGFNFWRVRATYSTDQGTAGGGDNPLEQPPTMFWEISRELVPIDRDTDGNAILNSAGQPPATPPTTPRSSPALIYRRNEPYFSVQRALKYSNKIGSKPINIRGIGSVDRGQSYCDYIKPISEYTQDAKFVRVEYRIEFRDGIDPFQLRIPDLGRWGFRDDGDDIVPGEIVDSRDSQPVSFDVRLNGIGQPIEDFFKIGKAKAAAVGNPNVPEGLIIDEDLSTGQLTILQWDTIEEADLNELKL
jgi:hypothetical protein